MIAVTIALGDPWREIATNAATRMRAMTGLKTAIVEKPIRDYPHPSWWKCDVIELFPDVDSFLLFDADVLCLIPWNPIGLFECLHRSFCAVPDLRTQDVYDECRNLGLSFPDVYINGGLTIFGREHKPIWDATRCRYPVAGRFLEQGNLNLALLETQMPVCRLPRKFNFLCHGDPTPGDLAGVVNAHFCTPHSEQDILRKQKALGL